MSCAEAATSSSSVSAARGRGAPTRTGTPWPRCEIEDLGPAGLRHADAVVGSVDDLVGEPVGLVAEHERGRAREIGLEQILLAVHVHRDAAKSLGAEWARASSVSTSRTIGTWKIEPGGGPDAFAL